MCSGLQGTLTTAIVHYANLLGQRRLVGEEDDGGHRRLSMSSAKVDAVVVDTFSPSPAPSPMPTMAPTPAPTIVPTPTPSRLPTPQPTPSPTMSPTRAPTRVPTSQPTQSPITVAPTRVPNSQPTQSAITMAPTPARAQVPELQPTQSQVSQMPTTARTQRPTLPLPAPTITTTVEPTPQPTMPKLSAVPSSSFPAPLSAPGTVQQPTPYPSAETHIPEPTLFSSSTPAPSTSHQQGAMIIVVIIAGTFLISVCLCGLVAVKLLKPNATQTYAKAPPELPITMRQANDKQQSFRSPKSPKLLEPPRVYCDADRAPRSPSLDADVLGFVDSLRLGEGEANTFCMLLAAEQISDMEKVELLSDADWGEVGVKLGLRLKIRSRLKSRVAAAAEHSSPRKPKPTPVDASPSSVLGFRSFGAASTDGRQQEPPPPPQSQPPTAQGNKPLGPLLLSDRRHSAAAAAAVIAAAAAGDEPPTHSGSFRAVEISQITLTERDRLREPKPVLVDTSPSSALGFRSFSPTGASGAQQQPPRLQSQSPTTQGDEPRGTLRVSDLRRPLAPSDL